jgi:hypothetical protein
LHKKGQYTIMKIYDRTIASQYPETIELVFEYLLELTVLEWIREEEENTIYYYGEMLWLLFKISIVSHQWSHIMQKTVRKEYLNIERLEHKVIANMYHCSDWLVRQVEPLVTHYDALHRSTIRDSTLSLLTQCRRMTLLDPPVNISNQGLEHLTNLTRLSIGINIEKGITWPVFRKLTNLTSLEVKFHDPAKFQVFPSMTSLTKLSVRAKHDDEPLYYINLSQLSELTNLTTLEIGEPWNHNFFTSLTGLTTLVLRNSIFSGKQIFMLTPQLRHLEIRKTDTDCGNLICLTNLRVLVIHRTAQQDSLPNFHRLAELTSLQCLVMNDPTEGTRGLSLLTSLTLLDIKKCHAILPSHLPPLVILRYFTHTQCEGLETYSHHHHLPSLTRDERKDLFRSIVKK